MKTCSKNVNVYLTELPTGAPVTLNIVYEVQFFRSTFLRFRGREETYAGCLKETKR